VAVLSGGRSSEHEISLASARSVVDALDPDRYEVVPVAIGRDGRWELPEARRGALLEPGRGEALVPAGRNGAPPAEGVGALDVVFPVLHGPFGEDGTVQGLCEVLGLPYVGSGVLGSALAMDKHACKAVLRDAGIRVAESLVLAVDRQAADDPDVRRLVEERFAYPVFVKPARLGSSVGISKVHGPEELEPALRLAYEHDPKVLVEEFLRGRELECGVLGNEDPIASPVGEVVAAAEWYDYASKYTEGGSDLVVPAAIPDAAATAVRRMALDAFRVCDCAGMARIDFFLLEDGSPVLNEINTIPGFTRTSYYARLFEAGGIAYASLLDRLIELALERHARASRFRY
jgi:D-alanine-D-alanine ligase